MLSPKLEIVSADASYLTAFAVIPLTVSVLGALVSIPIFLSSCFVPIVDIVLSAISVIVPLIRVTDKFCDVPVESLLLTVYAKVRVLVPDPLIYDAVVAPFVRLSDRVGVPLTLTVSLQLSIIRIRVSALYQPAAVSVVTLDTVGAVVSMMIDLDASKLLAADNADVHCVVLIALTVPRASSTVPVIDDTVRGVDVSDEVE